MMPLPTGWILGGAGVAIAAALSWGGVQTVRLARAEAALSDEREQRADEHALASERERERERMQGQREREATDVSHDQLQSDRIDVGVARGAADRLRDRTAVVARQCPAAAPAPVPTPGAPAGAPGALLADVQTRLDEAAGQLADYADQLSIARQHCEAAWPRETPPSGGGVNIHQGAISN